MDSPRTRDGLLDALAAEVEAAREASRQPSYQRGVPAAASRQPLVTARERLAREPTSARAWRLLSTVREILLDYAGAAQALESALDLAGNREPRDLKRLARLRSEAPKLRVLKKHLDR
jgi:hypothetical protein